MTGRERVAAAMRHEIPDRVPVFCQLSLGHYMLQYHETGGGPAPYEVWFSPQVFAGALVGLAERYGFDGVLVNLPGRTPDWQAHIVRIERGASATTLFWDNGGQSLCPDDDNVHYNSTRSFVAPSIDAVDPSDLFYIEPHCITEVRHPFAFDFGPPPVPGAADYFPPFITDTLDETIRLSAGRFHVSAEVFSPFTQFLELFGYVEALTGLLTEPQKVERILERLAEGTARLGAIYAARGADAILVSSAFAGGGFISRDHYRQFVQPCERSVVESLRETTDVPVYVHTCGRIGDRIDLLAQSGYDGVDTMDPAPLGDTDIRKVKREFGDRLFLKGNIDPVNLLLNSTPQGVRAHSEQLIRAVGAGGGYILSSACSVAPYAPPENILQLSRASKDLA
ncbi:MAG TPA: uroporphyrinogen decarboxylase family protein [Spirochaetia bacterium]|nr:uroporphyrinogen decarboxylase family protein [Spirochaetia bacterium]